jgi:hypothetical protein
VLNTHLTSSDAAHDISGAAGNSAANYVNTSQERELVSVYTPDSSQVKFTNEQKIDDFLNKLKLKNLNLKLNYKHVAAVAKDTEQLLHKA